MRMVKRKEDFAHETPRKSEPHDRLTRNVLAAEAAGMSYGKYKGLEYEKIQRGELQPPEEKKKAAPSRRRFELTCAQCGMTFIGGSRLRKYCSEECKKKHDNVMQREKNKEAQKEE